MRDAGGPKGEMRSKHFGDLGRAQNFLQMNLSLPNKRSGTSAIGNTALPDIWSCKPTKLIASSMSSMIVSPVTCTYCGRASGACAAKPNASSSSWYGVDNLLSWPWKSPLSVTHAALKPLRARMPSCYMSSTFLNRVTEVHRTIVLIRDKLKY